MIIISLFIPVGQARSVMAGEKRYVDDHLHVHSLRSSGAKSGKDIDRTLDTIDLPESSISNTASLTSAMTNDAVERNEACPCESCSDSSSSQHKSPVAFAPSEDDLHGARASEGTTGSAISAGAKEGTIDVTLDGSMTGSNGATINGTVGGTMGGASGAYNGAIETMEGAVGGATCSTFNGAISHDGASNHLKSRVKDPASQQKQSADVTSMEATCIDPSEYFDFVSGKLPTRTMPDRMH